MYCYYNYRCRIAFLVMKENIVKLQELALLQETAQLGSSASSLQPLLLLLSCIDMVTMALAQQGTTALQELLILLLVQRENSLV